MNADLEQVGQETSLLQPSTVLTAHNWSGNAHELQNRIPRALSTTLEKNIHPTDLRLQGKKLTSLKEARARAEKHAICQALAIISARLLNSWRLVIPLYMIF